jgi:predicted RNA-binding Zn-ribbon protein involved in translation (DUF1610 family)
MNSITASPFSIPAQGNREFFVYEYSVRIDEECLPAVWEQIRKARQLYNNIIAEIRQMFDDMNSFVFSHADASAITLAQDIESLSEQFKEAKARQDEESVKEIIRIRREKRIELFGQLRSVREAHKTEIRQRFLSRVGNKSSCPTYQLRCDAVSDGLGWGTANQVLGAALQAFSDRIKKGAPPLFSQGHEKKQDSLRLQFTQAGGCPVESFLKGEHSGLRLNPINGYGRRKYGEFSFRLGSATEDSYATGTCYFDRPLPQNATIVSASLVTRRIGKDYRHALQLVTKLPGALQTPIPVQRERFATIHFGWVMTETGRHVMAIANQADPGAARLISLPTSIEEDYTRARKKASARSKLLNEIVKEIKQFTLPTGADSEIAEAQANIKRLPGPHLSQSRLYRLWNLLHNAGISFPALDAWRKQDRLLWQDATYIPRRARMRRRDFYRDIACELSKTYRTIVMETIDLKKANTKLDVKSGEAPESNRKARYGQKLAAIYEAISALRNACSKSGSIILELSGEKTISQCGYCASTEIIASPENHQILRCPACGAEINRKQNGAAVTWQLANQHIDALTEEARAFIAADDIRKRTEAAAKREKMVSARIKARAERKIGTGHI